MKLSWNWLQDFTNGTKMSPEKVGEKLTLHTAELEEIITVADSFNHVFAGKLLSYKAHPSAEKLHVGTFDLGKKGKKQIVFGSVHKLDEGIVYPVAIDGARLKTGVEIKNTEIRGEKSEGMVCDNIELGLKNVGLLTFSEKDVGKSLPEICPEFQDILFDIDNKSLTHRPDLMGHRGFAREITAIFEGKLILPEPVVSLPHDQKEFPVKIDTDRCRRFCALKISNVNVQPSDLSTQIRLENLGNKAISNVVDITNWIMLEFGQPMHAFDAAKVEGEIIVRQAKKGEKLLALDTFEYELTEEDIVIADEKKVLSIAGIMGGVESSVHEGTTDIIFESANFDPVSVRKTSQRLGLRSESSMRFEKSLDPMACRPAILSAAEKLLDICPRAKIETELTDEFPHPFDQTSIKLDPEMVRRHSGINIADEEIVQKLESIGFSVSKSGANLDVEVPSFRATKDVAIPEDLVEEVVRLHGFEDVEATLPDLPITPPKRHFLRDLEWDVRETLAARGFLETYNYSFVNDQDAAFTGMGDYVQVANPLSEEQTQLRRTLISNLVRNVESDLRTHGSVDFFEFGHVFTEGKEALPEEVLHLALFQASLSQDENEMFFVLKQELIQLFEGLNVGADFQPAKKCEKYFHPSKSADILIDGKIVGVISVLHPGAVPVKNAAIVFAEIDVEKLIVAVRAQEKKYQKISPFPSVLRDLSIVLGDRVLMSDIERVAQKAAPVLQKMDLFDEFSDEKKLGKNLKNLAFHLEFRSHKKTLEESEIDKGFNAIVKALEKEFGAKLRLDFDQGK